MKEDKELKYYKLMNLLIKGEVRSALIQIKRKNLYSIFHNDSNYLLESLVYCYLICLLTGINDIILDTTYNIQR